MPKLLRVAATKPLLDGDLGAPSTALVLPGTLGWAGGINAPRDAKGNLINILVSVVWDSALLSADSTDPEGETSVEEGWYMEVHPSDLRTVGDEPVRNATV